MTMVSRPTQALDGQPRRLTPRQQKIRGAIDVVCQTQWECAEWVREGEEPYAVVYDRACRALNDLYRLLALPLTVHDEEVL